MLSSCSGADEQDTGHAVKVIVNGSHEFKKALSQEPRMMSGSAAIPIIDLDAAGAAEHLLEAAATYGFLYVKHRNLFPSPGDVNRMFNIVCIPRLNIQDH